MFDHIGLTVPSLPESVGFYTRVLAPLSLAVGYENESVAGFGPRGAPAFWLHAGDAKPASHAHVAFRAPSRAAVDAFHQAGLQAGARDNGQPGLRPDYGSTYYAAFLIDADGNNIEAVCMSAE